MKERENSEERRKKLNYVSPSTWENVKSIWKADEDTDDFRREYGQ